MNSNLVKNLENIINDGIEQAVLPYVKGNSIRIKQYIVRKSKAGWLVYDSKTNSQVAKLFSKSSAVALAKGLAQGKDITVSVISADRIIQKHYTDCIFYKNTISKTSDTFKKELTQIRYEISKSKTENARRSLDEIIFA